MDSISLNAPHELILQATLLKGEPAASAYYRWRATVPFDDVDPETYRLLPGLHLRLIDLQIEDELTQRLRGIYRRTWYANQFARQYYGEIFQTFRNAAIDFRLVGGGLLVAHYAGDPGIYPQDDSKLLLKPEQLDRVKQILLDIGWVDVSSSRKEITYCIDGRYYLGLHGSIVHGLSPVERRAAELHHWLDGECIEIENVRTPVLNAVDQVLFWVNHGQLGGGWPTIRWLYYTWNVLECSPAFNWDDLMTQARARHKTQTLVEVLSYLEIKLDLSVPNDVLVELTQSVANVQPLQDNQLAKQWIRTSRHWIRHTARRVAATLQGRKDHR